MDKVCDSFSFKFYDMFFEKKTELKWFPEQTYPQTVRNLSVTFISLGMTGFSAPIP